MGEIAIRNVDDLKEMSRTMGVSTLLPDSLKGKPADVFVTILFGHELGLTPMASVQGIYVVKGRPFLSAQTWIALARRAGHLLSVTEHDDRHCVVDLERGDTHEKHRSTYTFAEAKVAGLETNANWAKHPKRMLLARAVANGCRFLCPEVALGAMVEGEEITDDAEPLTHAEPPSEAVVDAELVDPDELAAQIAGIQQEFADPEDSVA